MHIRIATMKRTEKLVNYGYEYYPGKHKWFTDILWNILRRMKVVGPYFGKEKVYTYNFSDKDQDDLIKYLMSSSMIPYNFYDKPKNYKFVMGNKQFMEVMNQRAVEFPMNFNVGPVYNQVQGEPLKVFDIEVEVLPWIDGVALVKK